MAVITISRELGSEGDAIANIICQELGYRRVDKAMLSQIAAKAGVDVKAVLAKERAVARRPRLISGQLSSLYGRAPGAFGERDTLDDRTYARIVRETMEKYAKEDDVVIIGRGGQMVLRNWPTALHVHLYAPQEVRVKRLMERLKISELEAKRLIAGSDERKRHYIRTMHDNANWKDIKHYHLAIDTARIPPEIAARIIIEAAGARDAVGA